MKRKKKRFFKHRVGTSSYFFSGILIGIANLIPGVSGGTIAVVMGIYDELITALSDVIPNPFKRLQSLITLSLVFAGVLCGIYFFSSLIETLISDYTYITLFFFMGLILGSIPIIYKTHRQMRPNFLRVSVFCLFCLAVIALPLLTSTLTISGTPSPILLVMSGCFAAGSMIVPGISGSFILYLLGTYQPILKAVSVLDFKLLLWVAFGAIIGIVLVIKTISKALKRFPSISQYAILGMLIGSVAPLLLGLKGVCSDASVLGQCNCIIFLNQCMNIVVQGVLCFIAGFLLVRKLGK